jgi:hypothetical protein
VLVALVALVACSDTKESPKPPPALPQPAPPPPAKPRYVANRATAALPIAASPPERQERWTGTYAGSLTMTRGFDGSLTYKVVVTDDGDGVLIEEPGVLTCRAVKSPANPNLAACAGRYVVVTTAVDYEVAAAMHADALAIVLYTLDGSLAAQGHPDITVPGTTAAGVLEREKPR